MCVTGQEIAVRLYRRQRFWSKLPEISIIPPVNNSFFCTLRFSFPEGNIDFKFLHVFSQDVFDISTYVVNNFSKVIHEWFDNS